YNAAQTTGTTTVVQEPITDAVGTYWALAFSPYVPTHQLANIIGLQAALDAWQDTLVSGTNIKTVNGNSLLGSGDITLPLGEVNTASNVGTGARSEEHTSELQSREKLVCRLLLEKKKRISLFL